MTRFTTAFIPAFTRLAAATALLASATVAHAQALKLGHIVPPTHV